MREVVTAGTAPGFKRNRHYRGRKTGTAQWKTKEPSHAWFTGFGPYNDPEIAVTVLVEAGGEGSYTAVPVARKVFEWWAQNRIKN